MEEIPGKVKVIIADDHFVVREGLRVLLEQDEGLQVVGEASNGKEVLGLLQEMAADVVLMDVNMPNMDGYQTTEEVSRSFPGTKVIALSMHTSLPIVQKMLASGAVGYLLKTTSKVELTAAVKLVAAGGQYISGELSFKLLEHNLKGCAEQDHEGTDGKKLSRREVEVLTLISDGYTNAEIAEKLFTSKRTIETHRQNILEKTHTKNTAHLIKYAFEHRIIGTDKGTGAPDAR
ncbi:response regulator transcription factor [Pontibacter litorisediminis]|uniref:response regulator transcription factor n=1 Tax=Pontibacter litorisediminis TaxID=1846260 RepID=UPI0023EBC066|nr:response regulator transcription factor [Pontibacter litorisediminis]